MVFPLHYCYFGVFCVEFQLYIVPPFQTSSGFPWKDLDGNFSETLSWLVEYQARHKRCISWFCSDSLLLGGMAFQVFVLWSFHGWVVKITENVSLMPQSYVICFLQLPVESIYHLHPLTVHTRHMSCLCFLGAKCYLCVAKWSQNQKNQWINNSTKFPVASGAFSLENSLFCRSRKKRHGSHQRSNPPKQVRKDFPQER